MKKLNYLFLLIIITLLFNCQSEDSEELNSAPSNFTITVSEIQSSKAKLNWTQAIDPNGDSVTYTIKLNDDTIIQNLSENSYNLEGLTNGTNYDIKIIAKDSKGAETTSLETFSTNNLPIPVDFNISISDINYTNARLNWTESSTSENNAISYTVLLNNEILQEDINTLSYELTSLEIGTDYEGQVKAIADNGQVKIMYFSFTTLENNAPDSFSVSLINDEIGFSYTVFSFETATDPENDDVEYFVLLNNEDVSNQLFRGNFYPNDINLPSTAIPERVLRIQNLTENTIYNLQIKAVDAYANETYSNIINFQTKEEPADNFEIILNSSSGNGSFTIKWDKQTVPFASNGVSVTDLINGSNFIVDNVKKSLGTVYIFESDDIYRVEFGSDAVSTNIEHTLQLELNWGFNNKKSYSNILNIINIDYSDTTVEVETSTVYNSTSTSFPLQFAITFQNGLISEFENYDIYRVSFFGINNIDNITFFEQGAPNKGYLTGNITQEEFNILDAENYNYGYIVVRDQSGFHKIEFMYSIVN